VPELGEVQADDSRPSERPGGGPCLHRPDDADLDSPGEEAVVESLCAALGVGAAPVDDEPDRNALGRLADQRLGESVAHDAGAEAELVDVDRGRGGGDVLEHPRVEGVALDEHLGRGGRALGKREREFAQSHRSGQQPLRVFGDALVRNRVRGICHEGRVVSS
jgi:hypothetical protein